MRFRLRKKAFESRVEGRVMRLRYGQEVVGNSFHRRILLFACYLDQRPGPDKNRENANMVEMHIEHGEECVGIALDAIRFDGRSYSRLGKNKLREFMEE